MCAKWGRGERAGLRPQRRARAQETRRAHTRACRTLLPSHTTTFVPPIFPPTPPLCSKPTRISIRFDATTGERVRFSKRSGALIPYPEASLKYTRTARPPAAGPGDTPAAAAAAVTYTAPPELVPYLDRARSPLFRPLPAGGGKAGEEALVPWVVRNLRLRKKNRNKILRKWRAGRERARFAEDLDVYLGAALKEAADKAEKAAAEAAPAVAAAGGAPGGGSAGGAGRAAAAAAPELR